jgi:very-short-patch-repair endonuclease
VDEPIPPEDITTIDGIPVTKPARTLLDLATVEPETVVERCLDDALRRRLVSLAFLERWLQDPRRKKHRGAGLLQRLIDDRATVGVTESPLEDRVLRILRDGGLPIPRLQYEVRDGDRFVARPDFAYPNERVAVEAEGFLHHDRRQTFDAERSRGNDLQAMGWKVLRITAKHVEDHAEEVVEWVRRALARQPSTP